MFDSQFSAQLFRGNRPFSEARSCADHALSAWAETAL